MRESERKRISDRNLVRAIERVQVVESQLTEIAYLSDDEEVKIRLEVLSSEAASLGARLRGLAKV